MSTEAASVTVNNTKDTLALGGWLALCLLYQKSGLLMCGEPYEKFQRMLSWIRDTWAPASGRDCFSLSNKVVSLLSALEEFYLKDCTWL